MLELSVRRGQSNCSTVYIFCQLRRKRLPLSWFFDRTGWFWQPLNFASAASVCNSLKQIIFFRGFSIFESGGITKHLMTGPSENSAFCSPSTSMFPSASPRGTLRVSGKQNSLFPFWPVIKCLLIRSHVTKNQPILVLILLSENLAVWQSHLFTNTNVGILEK